MSIQWQDIDLRNVGRIIYAAILERRLHVQPGWRPRLCRHCNIRSRRRRGGLSPDAERSENRVRLDLVAQNQRKVCSAHPITSINTNSVGGRRSRERLIFNTRRCDVDVQDAGDIEIRRERTTVSVLEQNATSTQIVVLVKNSELVRIKL